MQALGRDFASQFPMERVADGRAQFLSPQQQKLLMPETAAQGQSAPLTGATPSATSQTAGPPQQPTPYWGQNTLAKLMGYSGSMNQLQSYY